MTEQYFLKVNVSSFNKFIIQIHKILSCFDEVNKTNGKSYLIL